MILQNQRVNKDIIIGIDAGTSLIKAVAFTLNGKEIGNSSVPNEYKISSNGNATQSLELTWKNCCRVIKLLKDQFSNLENRVSAISVTGQGDGTWLIDENGEPVCDAWLWGYSQRHTKFRPNESDCRRKWFCGCLPPRDD